MVYLVAQVNIDLWAGAAVDRGHYAANAREVRQAATRASGESAVPHISDSTATNTG